MRFDFTPDEAQPAAIAVAEHLRQNKIAVSVEAPAWPDAPLRTTLVGRKSALLMLIEVQGTLTYSKSLRDLAAWIAARRHYAEFSLASYDEATTQVGMLSQLRADGVGLLVVEESGSIREVLKPKNPALMVNHDPTLRFGYCKLEVVNALTKFNDVDRKDGLRDMCELVERETEVLAVHAVRKGALVMSERDVERQDWSSQVETLASTKAYNTGYSPLVDSKLKADMHSFRGARNLIDHKVRTKRDDRRRQMQFAERMVQGPRLIAELMSLKRKLK